MTLRYRLVAQKPRSLLTLLNGAILIVTVTVVVVNRKGNAMAVNPSCLNIADHSFDDQASAAKADSAIKMGTHEAATKTRKMSRKAESVLNQKPGNQSPIDEIETTAELFEQEFNAVNASGGAESGTVFSNPLSAWHQQFIKEIADPIWSPLVQAQTESYLGETIGPDVKLVGIKCGSSVCEVKATSTSSENGERAANEWQATMSSMSNDAWFTTYGFAVPNSAIWSASDGRSFFVSYLVRSPH